MLEKLLEEIRALREARVLLDDVWNSSHMGETILSDPVGRKLENFYGYDPSE